MVLDKHLEAAARHAKPDLVGLARASLEQQGLDPVLAEKAVETVWAVMSSDIWKRAQASPCRLVEVPFQTLLAADPRPIEAILAP